MEETGLWAAKMVTGTPGSLSLELLIHSHSHTGHVVSERMSFAAERRCGCEEWFVVCERIAICVCKRDAASLMTRVPGLYWIALGAVSGGV